MATNLTQRGGSPIGEPPLGRRYAVLLRRGHPGLEREALLGAVHDDGVVRAELAAYDAARKGVLDVASDSPCQRSSAELRVVALLGDELLGERLEDDDLIHPVEELGPEGSFQGLSGAPLGLAEVHAVARGEAELPRGDEVLAAHVRGHYDDGVLEVDHPALGVREASVVEDLQERVEDLGMGLLDLVEEDDRVRTAPHLLCELSSLLVSDVAGRRADQA